METPKIQVRSANLKDLPILLQYEQGVVTAERPFDPTIQKGPVNYYDLEALIQDEESCVAVAEVDGKVVASGFALVKKARHYLDHEDYAYFGFMYTDEAFRGQGLNALIIDFLKDWAYDKGLKEIRLTVYCDNIPAIKAYEKVGFKKHMVEMRLT
ncbi:GNAT family N-acetyltransferase [Flagellimonas zhangzhouensis]|uniref:Ribosomal protein S18 acetylase RimI n=1 Tax=Flagellimonas zhangzhouensis TaxID=1073328 RepID=A0A1H2YWF1_9FLAO|nr:GNAT family N-acetyltransferase [Allomuricauda zhangzhouensis]SDR05746.1 Ribosomal protein S18 acetylase RimI [Allomuricauda zhangzhouensis]SDX09078.1 Ribosomal protein S18 acetylase RimI [Allomuricauda zhangzhouensis]